MSSYPAVAHEPTYKLFHLLYNWQSHWWRGWAIYSREFGGYITGQWGFCLWLPLFAASGLITCTMGLTLSTENTEVKSSQPLFVPASSQSFKHFGLLTFKSNGSLWAESNFVAFPKSLTPQELSPTLQQRMELKNMGHELICSKEASLFHGFIYMSCIVPVAIWVWHLWRTLSDVTSHVFKKTWLKRKIHKMCTYLYTLAEFLQTKHTQD